MRRKNLISSIFALVVSILIPGVIVTTLIADMMFWSSYPYPNSPTSDFEMLFTAINMFLLYSVMAISFVLFVVGIVGLCLIDSKYSVVIGVLAICIVIASSAIPLGAVQVVFGALRAHASVLGISLVASGVIALVGAIVQIVLMFAFKKRAS
jgi:hypothetical protein